jgi:hypothetical protein
MAWERVKASDDFDSLQFGCIFIVVVNIILGIYLDRHIAWTTQSYKYPEFTQNLEFVETFVVISLVGLISSVCFIVAMLNTGAGFALIKLAMRSPSDSLNRHYNLITLLQLLWFVLWVGVASLPVIGYFNHPKIVPDLTKVSRYVQGPISAFNSQMKNTCNGFDTRTNMQARRSSYYVHSFF